MKTRIMNIALLSSILLMAGGFTLKTFSEWPVPDKYKKMANPVKSDAESLKAGKTLWVKHCQSCHGKTGLGDGSKAATLKTEPGDFSTDDFHKQSDGSLFYKIEEGREDMPSFKKKIPDDDDVWSLVNFVRTLKK